VVTGWEVGMSERKMTLGEWVRHAFILGICPLVCVPFLLSSLFSLAEQEGWSFPSFSFSSSASVSPAFPAVTGGIMGPPSLSAAFVDRVLAYYGSPAQGTGQALYDDSLTFGIDDAYALAFFQHESSFGEAGWGAANRSLGNIRCTAGYACGGGYRAYASWEEGFRDWYQLIRTMYVGQLGLTSVEQIIPVYAPAADHNDEAAYINAVESAVAIWRTGRIA
jgi:hypothetical protein